MCQLHQNNTAKSPVHPWEWTSKPWVRIHIDYAGSFLIKMFLIIIDSHSKWLEVIPTSDAGSKETIKILRSVFATHDLPGQCVSDNGSAFMSIEFEEFLQLNGIKQIRTSPYHPASNGLLKEQYKHLRKQ